MSNLKKTALTDVQFAYMSGRNNNLHLGGISTHFYIEYDSELDPLKFEKALNKVIERQEMLRAYICEDGTQCIMEKAPYYNVECEDIRDKQDKASIIEKYRSETSNRVFPLDKWPMFGFKFFRMSDDIYRLAIDFDMMIIDGMSTELFVQEILSYYDSDRPAKPLNHSFSDFIEYQSERNERLGKEDRQFWMDRIDEFVTGPFADCTHENIFEIPIFDSLETKLVAEQWHKVADSLKKNRILPTVYLLTAYAKTVSAWTNTERLTINMTVSDRKGTVGNNYQDVIGDFTKILPITFEFNRNDDLIALSRKAQKKISEYKKHLNFNIFSFVKEVSINNQTETMTAFPFVFTGMLFDLAGHGWWKFGKRIYQVSQTPQLLLDNQVTLKNGNLIVHWDYPKQYWDRERLEAMQQYFMDTVISGISDVLTNEAEKFISTYNDTKIEHNYISAIEMFEQWVENEPDNTAVITNNSEITYEELDIAASREANMLIEKYGCKKGYIVVGERNISTIVNMLAVLKTGGFYVPTAPDLPEKRIQYMLEKSESVAILNSSTYDNEDCDSFSDGLIKDVSHDSSDVMYVIYTSGTTGKPKGVTITNSALVNTILDINERFDVNEEDQIIGISSFGFDLSVYDVFGALTSGGSFIIHDKQENVYGMIEKLKTFPITIWNTVPALMQLTVDALDSDYVNETLRLVMLSGDWIPVELPDMIRKKFPNAKVISLGGATEAAIWSIYYPVDKVEEHWSSIPYGYPLSNQQMYILGYDMKPLPANIEGDIYIGGEGVALGYLNDPEKTAAAFFDDEKLGRIYKTGDRGYFSQNGYMVFCGRKDNQVKLHGNRIELGEIESCIKKHKNIATAVASVISDNDGAKRLMAYYVPESSEPYDKEWVDSTASKQAAAMDKASDNTPDYLSVENYKEITEALEDASKAIISNAFVKLGYFVEEGKLYTLEELFANESIVDKYRKLIEQWADTVAGMGAVKKQRAGVYQCIRAIEYIDVDTMYEEIMKKEGIKYWGGSSEFLMLCNKNVLEILKADVNPLTILFPEGDMERAENIYRYNPVAEYMNALVAEAVEQYIINRKGETPVRILEFGAGTGGTSAAILDRIKNYNVEYTFTDLSTFFTDKAKERFAEYDFINYRLFNIDEAPQSQGYAPASFDIIIGANVLHDARIIRKTLKNLRFMLSNEGMLAALEVTENKVYHKVSIGFIEGFSGYSDERLKKNVPLLSSEEWKKAMSDCGFKNTAAFPHPSKPAEAFEQHVILGYAANDRKYCDEQELLGELRGELPSYMIPERIYPLAELPLSANAKVDHKALPYEKKTDNSNTNIILPETETEQVLYDIIKETLGLDELSTDVNIFTIGADSLKSISVLTKLKSKNIDVSLSDMYKYSTIRQMAEFIDTRDSNASSDRLDTEIVVENFKPDQEHRYDPFPLSDLQESYYIGAHETEGFNSIPTAGYVEIECGNYDEKKIFHIIRRLIERHDMLRAYIDNDGIQHVLREIPEVDIPVTDISDRMDAEKEEYIKNLRKEMVATRLDLSKAPLFRLKITVTEKDTALLHIYADGQIMDGWSFQLFFTELGALYKDPDMEMEPLQVSFRDYIMYRQELKKTDKYLKDKEYWLDRIPNLPSAGVLPLENDITELKTVEGIQIECGIPIEQWRQIEAKAQQHGVSAFSVLMTSFGMAVARWNDKRRFLLNIPEFYRPPFHEDIFKILGECASFLLFVMEDDPNETFHEKTVRTQKQILELKDHNSFSGMEITREIYRNNNGYSEVLAPLVFGMLPDAPEFEEEFINIEKNVMKIRYQENHTSQIWIDVNTCVYSERIEFNYNSLNGLISPSVLEKLAFMQKWILSEAASNEDFWNEKVTVPMPDEDMHIIEKANKTEQDIKTESLAKLVSDAFIKYADKPFICMKGSVMTYKETGERVYALADKLHKNGIKAGDKVAVYMPKGADQLIAAYAVAYMGAVYTPIEYTYPHQLVENMMKWIDCRNMILSSEDEKAFVQSGFVAIVPDENARMISADVPAADIDEKAVSVIIHTSGTTGRPKAVMLRSDSLTNSIYFTNAKFEVGVDDAAMAVTNYSHDMSLYDMFGMMSAGGRIVLPQEKNARDPEYWLELMKEYRPTIWNSVPAMQEMLMEAVSDKVTDMVNSLRLIIMGGDYIKPSLLNKIRKVNESVRIISTGGPTETTLWNIMHEVVPEDLKSETVPYGKPIANNCYFILNENMQQLPVGVTGTLYAGGIGVSDGYCENKELTDERFITLSKNGMKVYNTGDRGHYRADGAIIFDGREDRQVKINGKRIELSAIASVAEEYAGADRAAAIKTDDNMLVLFYTGCSEMSRAKLSEFLPDYMLPGSFIHIDSMPVTANSKVDINELTKIYKAERKKKNTQQSEISGSDEIEKILKDKFCELLGISTDEVELDSDFFAMGGDSLIAMKLLSQLRETFEVNVSLTDLFTTSTIREMHALLTEKGAVLKK